MLSPDCKTVRSEQEGKQNGTVAEKAPLRRCHLLHKPRPRWIFAERGEQQEDRDLTLLIWLRVPRDKGTDCRKCDAGHGGHRPCCPHHPAVTRQAAVRRRPAPRSLLFRVQSGEISKCFFLCSPVVFIVPSLFYLFGNLYFLSVFPVPTLDVSSVKFQGFLASINTSSSLIFYFSLCTSHLTFTLPSSCSVCHPARKCHVPPVKTTETWCSGLPRKERSKSVSVFSRNVNNTRP